MQVPTARCECAKAGRLSLADSRLARTLSAVIISGVMTLVTSGVSTARNTNWNWPAIRELWMHAYIAAWTVGFPVALFVPPLIRKAVIRLMGVDK
jgi:ABC-type anion transport system duplicated permease subunit